MSKPKWINVTNASRTDIKRASLAPEDDSRLRARRHQSQERRVKIKHGRGTSKAAWEMFWCTYWHKLTRAYEGYQWEGGCWLNKACSLEERTGWTRALKAALDRDEMKMTLKEEEDEEFPSAVSCRANRAFIWWTIPRFCLLNARLFQINELRTHGFVP